MGAYQNNELNSIASVLGLKEASVPNFIKLSWKSRPIVLLQRLHGWTNGHYKIKSESDSVGYIKRW